MEDEPTKEEVDRRARELAQRVMSKPYEPQKWPGKSKPPRKAKAKKAISKAAS